MACAELQNFSSSFLSTHFFVSPSSQSRNKLAAKCLKCSDVAQIKRIKGPKINTVVLNRITIADERKILQLT